MSRFDANRSISLARLVECGPPDSVHHVQMMAIHILHIAHNSMHTKATKPKSVCRFVDIIHRIASITFQMRAIVYILNASKSVKQGSSSIIIMKTAVIIVILCGIYSLAVESLDPYAFGELPIALCSLKNVTIHLQDQFEHAKNISGMFTTFPNYVWVQRCSGGCGTTGHGNALHHCAPDGVVIRSVHQRVQSICQTGRRVVKVREHTSCKCQCRHNPAGHCPLAKQKFNTESCRCVCANVQQKRQCALKRFTWGSMFWDESRCECRCPQFWPARYAHFTLKSPPAVCSKIYEFDHQRCRCVPKLLKSRKSSKIRTKSGKKKKTVRSDDHQDGLCYHDFQ